MEKKVRLRKSVWQLIQDVTEGHKNGRRFCFILGAGASMASNIKDGQSPAFEWMSYSCPPRTGNTAGSRRRF